MPAKICFVTVGTTQFSALIEAASSLALRKLLLKHGFTEVVLQYGTGRPPFSAGAVAEGATPASSASTRSSSAAQPIALSAAAGEHLHAEDGLTYRCFALAPSLTKFFGAADLVICHAGAGSVLDSLRSGKKPIVVVNELLADNHQVELAEAMAGMGHASSCLPQELVASVSARLAEGAGAAAGSSKKQEEDLSKADHGREFLAAVDRLMGFSAVVPPSSSPSSCSTAGTGKQPVSLRGSG